MFKAWFKRRFIHAKFEAWCPDIEAKILDEKSLKLDLEYHLNTEVRKEILRFVEFEVDKDICRRIAQDFLKNFDYKPILEEAMLKKFEGYVSGTVPPTYIPGGSQMDYHAQEQARLGQRRF